MKQRFSASTVLVVAAVVAAAAFAAGRSIHASSSSTSSAAAATAEPPVATTTSTALPPGHPPVETTGSAAALPAADTAESSLAWKVPSRWQVAQNPSSMRLATYRIPHAPGDAEDPEMAVSQAGGSIDANVERWIGQFGPDAKKTAKRTTKKVAGMDVTIVEIEGTYSGGMSAKGERESWALLGAIVDTPGMPHFFKMTGPAKSVRAARAELDELVGSLSTR